MSTPSRQYYMGPRPFERAGQVLFCGRKYEANELASLVIAHATVLLYAQSGTGKTSLLNAGLVPLLEAEAFEVLPAVRVRGELPDDLAASCNVYMFNVLSSLGANAQPAADTPPALTLKDYLRARPALLDTEGQPRPRALIFDQFEELFTFYPERAADRRAFFEQVRDALKAEPLLRVIFAIREEFLAELSPYETILPDQLRTRVRLERLREAAALEAVTGPLAGSGISFAPGVAENLVADLLQANGGDGKAFRGDYVEPVQLQVVCDELCRRLPPNVNSITSQHVRQFGNINDALARFYWDCLWQTQLATGVSTRRLRHWFSGVLITPEKTRDAVRFGKDKTGGLPNRAVTKLEEQHLVRGEERSGRGRWYELTHDRFIAPILTANEKARRRAHQIYGITATGIVSVLLVSWLMFTHARLVKAQRMAEIASMWEDGTRAYNEGHYQQAIDKYDHLLKLTANVETTTYNATDYRNRAISNSFECHLILASWHTSTNGFDQAEREITAAEQLKLKPARIHVAKGDLEVQRIQANVGSNNYHQAEFHYKNAIKIYRKLPGGHCGLGYVCLYEGKTKEAIRAFQDGIEFQEGMGLARTHLGLGEAYMWDGDYDQALAQTAQGIALIPLEPINVRLGYELQGHGRLQDIYFLKNRYDLAQAECCYLLNVAMTNDDAISIANACSNLADIALRRNKISVATNCVAMFEKYASDASDYNVWFVPGVVKAIADPQAASKYWQKALAKNNDSDPLQRMQRIVYRVALGATNTTREMRSILDTAKPPFGMQHSVLRDIELLVMYNLNSIESGKLYKLLWESIMGAKGGERSAPP